jgi:nicotinate phosphoribosyltransferase
MLTAQNLRLRSSFLRIQRKLPILEIRLYSKTTGKIKADLICLADEKLNEEENMVLFDPIDTWKKTKVLGGTYEVRELLVPVIKAGKRVYESPSVMELRDYCQKEQGTL